MEYNVISADDHIVEERNLFIERMPKEFRDQAPRMVRGADGGDGWSFGDKPPERTLGLEATAGRAAQVSGYKWEDIFPGNYDGAAHLEDMDKGGVDAALLFPTVTMSAWSMKDSPFALAMMKTFNTWMMEDFCGPNPDRLIGLPVLPVNHGLDETLAEFDRCLKLGAKGMHIPVFPDTNYVDRVYDPMWAKAAEAGVPLCFHRTSGGNDPAGRGAFRFDIPGINVAGTVIRFFSGVEPLTMLIFSGVFERHPELKIVDAEVNFGWVPFWAQTMEHSWNVQKGWANFPFKHHPCEPLGKNVFVTVLDDKLGFDLVEREPYLADMAMFSTDYPHSFCLWPNTQEYIDELTENVDEVSKQKILAGNAARVFNLN
jgi:predicted TIM-barrel fold metal-dependent hydrolase